MEKELNDGGSGSARTTWTEFRARVERDFLPTVRAATAAKYRTVPDQAESHQRPKLLAELTPAKVGELTSKPRAEPGYRGERKSPASVAGNLRHLKALLNWSHRQGMLPRKPVVDIPEQEVAAKDGR